MPDLTGMALRAREELGSYDQPTADAHFAGHVQEVSEAGAVAKPEFRERGAVGLVREGDPLAKSSTTQSDP
jgi:hypothetical protein